MSSQDDQPPELPYVPDLGSPPPLPQDNQALSLPDLDSPPALPQDNQALSLDHQASEEIQETVEDGNEQLSPNSTSSSPIVSSASDSYLSMLREVGELNISRLRPHEYALEQSLIIEDGTKLKWNEIFLTAGALVLIVYCMVVSGSYMETDHAFGSAVLRVEGTGYADLADFNMAEMVFDSYDVRIPEQEKNAIFISTRVIGYMQQKRVTHDGEQKICMDMVSKCPCNANEYTKHGMATGGCLETKCLINGWCTDDQQMDSDKPKNMEEKYDGVIQGVEHMIISFQVVVEFANFGVTKTVSMHPKKRGYTSWKLGDLLKGAQEDIASVADQGAIIVANMHWNCKYKAATAEDCIVSWLITRADNPSTKQSGVHYWITNYQSDKTIEIPGIKTKIKLLETRYLQKIFGVKILLNVTGEMKRFSFIGLVVNIGSMIGILSMVPFFLDIVLRRRKPTYAKMKDTDMEERRELHSIMIKDLLLEFLKGKKAESR